MSTIAFLGRAQGDGGLDHSALLPGVQRLPDVDVSGEA